MLILCCLSKIDPAEISYAFLSKNRNFTIFFFFNALNDSKKQASQILSNFFKFRWGFFSMATPVWENKITMEKRFKKFEDI